MTILLVEHDMDFVMKLVDRLVVMDFGSKLVEGTPAAVRADARRAGSLSRRRRMSGACAMLEIDDLHVAYGQVEAVRGVSLALDAGADRHRDRPERRRQDHAARRRDGPCCRPRHARFDGVRSARRSDVEARVERGLCLVPEKRELFGELTVADNLLPRRLFATPRPRRAEADAGRSVFARFPRLAERRGQRAEHALGRRAPDAGAGPRADVGAAPADARRAEPRPGAADRARDLRPSSRGLRDDGVSILLVEQNARAALETADYGYVLETGEIVRSGPATALMHDPKVVASYLGGH